MNHPPDPALVASDLRRRIAGEVYTDDVTRTLYASAACIYEIQPLGVVIPKDADDVAATIGYAAEHGLSVVPRGAATALAGQTVGAGLVVDVSRHLTNIEPLDDERVRVEPGVVLKRLEASLRARGRTFPPDPSSGRACTLGGMIANNAAGAHSVKYGTTADYVESLDVVMADGSRRRLERVPRPVEPGTLEAGIDTILAPAQELLTAHWPQSNKSSSGYNLPRAWSPEAVDPVALVCGSEGTLAFVVSAVLRTLAAPAATASALLCVAELSVVGELVNAILAWRPAALEILDRSLLRLLRHHESAALAYVEGDPDAVLLVEFDGCEPAEAVDTCERFAAAFGGGAGVSVRTASAPTEQARLWSVRHASNPILNRMPGVTKPITFIEDGAVLPERLPDYIRGLGEIMTKWEVEACIFGHAGNGHLHIKPVLNLRDEGDIAKMEAIADDVCELLIGLRGVVSGEHGDGLARTPLLRRLYGPVYPLFEQVKTLFDPNGVLNPGKVVAPEGTRVGDQLRLARGGRTVDTDTVFDRPEWRVEIEKCHGCGTCRDYCPVFLATGEEAATARAKANLLRAVSRGLLSVDTFGEASFKRVMDLCVNCQLCLTECPTQVDIPGLARRARAEYVRRRGQSLQNRVLADAARTARLNSRMAGAANRALRAAPLRGLMERVIGLDRRRALPDFASRPFAAYRTPGWETAARRVVYFPGCYAVYHDPDGEARAVVDVLETNGVAVLVPGGLECCGIAKLTVGSEDAARADAAHNVAVLGALVSPATPLVVSAASCGLALRSDYPELLGDGARRVAEQVVDIHEYLLGLHADGALDLDIEPLGVRVVYHEPCHLHVQPAAGTPARLLDLIPGVERVAIDDSCCGICGTFGLKAAHYELSMKMGEPLFEALSKAAPDRVLTGCGTCQMQIGSATALPVAHPIRLLCEAYRRRSKTGFRQETRP